MLLLPSTLLLKQCALELTVPYGVRQKNATGLPFWLRVAAKATSDASVSTSERQRKFTDKKCHSNSTENANLTISFCSQFMKYISFKVKIVLLSV